MARMPKPCAIPDCDKLANVPGTARGWCTTHYQRWQRTGDPLEVLRRRNICTVEGCEAFCAGQGLCVKHYTRMVRYGTTDAPRPWLDLPEGDVWCSGCKSALPRDCFGKNLRPSGQRCKRCDQRVTAAWRAANPGYTPQPRPNPARDREMVRRWRANNPDRSRAATQRRRARLVGATIGEPFTTAQICDRDNWTCGICADPIDADLSYPDPMSVSLDHVVPLARGGAHSTTNVQAAHLRCNLQKHLAPATRLVS